MFPVITESFDSGSAQVVADPNSGIVKKTFLSAEDLAINISGCICNERVSQKKIYTSFYDYAFAVCHRYTNNYDDAVEILNDSFLKVFKEIHRYKPAYSNVVASFKGWLRRIVIYTAIDHFRKNRKYRLIKNIDDENIQVSWRGQNALDKLYYEEVLKSSQKLTPGYKTIFNLFILEGFSHETIAKLLGISIGTSKSNLARARKQLQKILVQ